MQQPDLMGLPGDIPSQPLQRLFFALWPDDAVRQRLHGAAMDLKHAHPAGSRWIGPHRYHLTLQFLGDFRPLPGGLIDAASRAADKVIAPSFSLSVDRAGSFHNRSIAWWLGLGQPSEGLRCLWDDLGRQLARVGVRVVDGKLTPHVTVSRDAQVPLPMSDIASVDWQVDSFVLLESRFGSDPGYHLRGRWPLSAS